MLIEIGQATKVICNASVEERVPPHKKGSGGGWGHGRVMACPACHTRVATARRRAASERSHKEIQRLIGRLLRCDGFDGRRWRTAKSRLIATRWQVDGGTRCASITGARGVARRDLRSLIAAGKISASRARCCRGGGVRRYWRGRALLRI